MTQFCSMHSFKVNMYIRHTVLKSLESAFFFSQAKLYEISREYFHVINPYDGKRIQISHENCNNARNGDIVLVELLPIGKWKVNPLIYFPIINFIYLPCVTNLWIIYFSGETITY